MDYPDFLDLTKINKLSLYIHVPFCARKCDYCAFYSVAACPSEWQARWLSAMKVELEKCRALIGDKQIATVFIGGGTPSFLELSILEELFQEIGRFNLGRLQEYTIEANPESLSPGVLDLLKSNSIDRLSVGVQSLQPQELAVLGRGAFLEDTLKALELLAAEWPGRVNLDFISGIPGQSRSSLFNSLEKAIALAAPEHISLYSLTPEETTVLKQRFQEQGINYHPNQDSLWTEACHFLEALGFCNYEIANFAKPGKECLHNLVYWNLEPYWGVGPGAYSTLPGKTGIVRSAYAPDLALFNQQPEKTLTVEKLSPKDFLTDTMIMGWRLTGGVEKKGFKKRFGQPLEKLLPGFYKSLVRSKRLLSDQNYYRLDLQSRLFLDEVLLDFMEALDSLSPEELQVNWP